VTNHDLARSFLSNARIIIREADESLGRGELHRVVRKAQEAAELALKGLLRYLGVEYPKVHCIGEAVRRALVSHGLPETTAQRLARISDLLAPDRELSFNGADDGRPAEELFDRGAAEQSRALVAEFEEVLPRRCYVVLNPTRSRGMFSSSLIFIPPVGDPAPADLAGPTRPQKLPLRAGAVGSEWENSGECPRSLRPRRGSQAPFAGELEFRAALAAHRRPWDCDRMHPRTSWRLPATPFDYSSGIRQGMHGHDAQARNRLNVNDQVDQSVDRGSAGHGVHVDETRAVRARIRRAPRARP
jgi:hypothetical protein